MRTTHPSQSRDVVSGTHVLFLRVHVLMVIDHVPDSCLSQKWNNCIQDKDLWKWTVHFNILLKDKSSGWQGKQLSRQLESRTDWKTCILIQKNNCKEFLSEMEYLLSYVKWTGYGKQKYTSYRVCYIGLEYSRPFPSCLLPQFENESRCKTIKMKMSLIWQKLLVNITFFSHENFASELVLKLR